MLGYGDDDDAATAVDNCSSRSLRVRAGKYDGGVSARGGDGRRIHRDGSASSRDARFVAIHDATLERTTNGRGAVRDFTLAELRELDAGSWFVAKSETRRGVVSFAGERIPTLEEILEFAREANVVFYLEIKADVARGAENILAGALVAALGGALRGPREVARVIVISFDAELLRECGSAMRR